MLREVDGKIETFYTENVREKQLHDARRKKRRNLDATTINDKSKKLLRKRQRTAKSLRAVKVELNGINSVQAHHDKERVD